MMAKLFDIPNEWRKRCRHIAEASLPGGHFFVDHHPKATTRKLHEFLTNHNL